jgi:hypothetical protein
VEIFRELAPARHICTEQRGVEIAIAARVTILTVGQDRPTTKGGFHMIGDWIEKVEYPQLPAMTDEELVSFFEEALFARLGTLNEDGTIHIAPIFFKYDNGQLLMATQDPSRKVRNIKRNNNVTVLIDTTDVPFKGALIYGTAELDYEDVISKRMAIFQRRLSREDAETYAGRLSGKWKCVILRITPARIASFDYSKA